MPGHIRVAREVIIDLHCVSKHGDPCADYAVVGGRVAQNTVGNLCHGVRNKHLLARPEINRRMPSANSSSVSRLSTSSSAIVWYLTIGPTISCGKPERYAPSINMSFAPRRPLCKRQLHTRGFERCKKKFLEQGDIRDRYHEPRHRIYALNKKAGIFENSDKKQIQRGVGCHICFRSYAAPLFGCYQPRET